MNEVSKANMEVYRKLAVARAKLRSQVLKKSGLNKFAGYQYFELGDFLHPTLEIFDSIGLIGIVSFTKDEAMLSIVDVDGGGEIVITSPFGSAALKGCHEVQNIGAVETYQRRYLWVAAMEIVEHDALDATTGRKGDGPIITPRGEVSVDDKRMSVVVRDSHGRLLIFCKVCVREGGGGGLLIFCKVCVCVGGAVHLL